MSGRGWSHPERGLKETVAAHPAITSNDCTISPYYPDRDIGQMDRDSLFGRTTTTSLSKHKKRQIRNWRDEGISIMPQSGIAQKDTERDGMRL
jgi:hypothetical protein